MGKSYQLPDESIEQIIAEHYADQFAGVHEAANLFPLPTADEFADLCASIAERGLEAPLIRDQQSRALLDGRSRLLACHLTGTELKIRDECIPDTLAAYELSIIWNLKRRHLNAGQKAMIGDDFRDVYTEEAKARQGTRTDLNMVVNLPPCSDEEPAGKKNSQTDFGKARDHAGKAVGVGGSYLDRARALKQHAPDLAKAVRNGARSLSEAYQQAQPAIREARVIASKKAEQDTSPREIVMLLDIDGNERWPYQKPIGKEQFNRQTSDRIDWADWSWNPAVGCKHGCTFCYARSITADPRTANSFPAGFEPAFYPHRLVAPKNTTCPNDPDRPSRNRVFVCSMSDLFGNWVPDEWIAQVFESAMAAPEWEYLFLTKWPLRYRMLASLPKAWFGASIIQQVDVKRVEKDMKAFETAGIKWVSLEPMLGPIKFNDLSWCDLMVIGAQTATNQPATAPMPGHIPAFSPKIHWVGDVVRQCEDAGVPVYLKENLHTGPGMLWPKQEPLRRKHN